MNGTVQLALEERIRKTISKISQDRNLSSEDSKELLEHYLGLMNNKNYTVEAIVEELYRMLTETNFASQKLSDIKNMKAYGVGDFNVNSSSSNPTSYSINNMEDFEIDIIDVDDGPEAEWTGVIPTNVNFENFAETQEVSDGQSKGKQKTLGGHPGAGGLHWGEDSGFMTFLLVIFLAGISSGIIFMIILNFISK